MSKTKYILTLATSDEGIIFFFSFSTQFIFCTVLYSSLQFAWAKQGHSCGFSLDMGNF